MNLPDLPENLVWWLTGLSLGSLVATLIGIPWVVARLPSDYFSRKRRTVWRLGAEGPVVRLVVGVAKNALGVLLVLLGLIMLITPGQGVLTILIGLMLTNFPGKFRLERWLVRKPGVLRALNWLRRRTARAPFEDP